MKRLVLLLGTIVVLLAGCGGSSPKPYNRVALDQKRCPVHVAYLGCDSVHLHLSIHAAPPGVKFGTRPKLVGSPGGCKIPDVSSWQGQPDWRSAKPYICGGIAKAGEYSQDPDFNYNWNALKSLGLWHTSYWFVRGYDCQTEAQNYINVLNSVGYRGDRLAGPPVLDMEVGEAYGHAVCMANALHAAFGVYPVIYTAPGTWPGGDAGGLLAWPASYGPDNPPCLPWTCSHYVAFQFAAPPWVDYYVPGLGYQDESVNYYFTSLRPFAGPPPPPPDPYHYSHFQVGPFFSHQFGKLYERQLVEWYDGVRKHPVLHAKLLHKWIEPELLFLANRIIAIVNENHPCVSVGTCGSVNWNLYHRGERQLLLRARAEGQRIVK